MICILCSIDEPKASKDVAYVICSHCVGALVAMTPENKGRLHREALDRGHMDKALALKENFLLKSPPPLDDAALLSRPDNDRLRAILRLCNIPVSLWRRWAKSGVIPKRYADRIRREINSEWYGSE